MAVNESKAGGNGAVLFAGLPRRRWVGGAMLVIWFALFAALTGDFVPTASPGDWLYGVEARRDAYARNLARANASPGKHLSRPQVVASRAER